MNKPFLLIAGDNCYPCPGAEDWKKCYSTFDEARAEIIEIPHYTYFTKGKNKGEIKSTFFTYKLKFQENEKYESEYDWCDIIDLRDWAN